MSHIDFTKEIIGIKGLIVKKVVNKFGETHITCEMEKKEHVCPRCGARTDRIHDYREQEVKDMESFGQKVIMHLRKRRYKCKECGKEFIEENPELGRYQRMTRREIEAILKEFKGVRSIKDIARSHNISRGTAGRIFGQLYFVSPAKLPEYLAIDEFKGNADGEKYQCILTDPNSKSVLDILPERRSESLYGYFSKFNNRKDVKYVVMDMSSLFREVVKTAFPQAKIIADRFHVVRQVCWAMENVRKDVQKQFSSGRRKYFKRSKAILLKHNRELRQDQKDQLIIMLKSSERLSRAYYLLQMFYDIMDSKAERDVIKKRLAQWIVAAESYDLPEFKACTTAIRNWINEILNAFEYPYSNGYTEGTNNKIKVLKRNAYGIRTFRTLRNRILAMTA